MPPFVNDIESFRLVDARGTVRTCSRSENAELFRLAVGGFGLFGFVYSVTLRLVPRRKLERSVEVRDIAGLVQTLDERVREGFTYGDFQLSVDETSEGFLRAGVLSCYRPVDDALPMPSLQRELGETDMLELFQLAHTNKAEAFKRLAGFHVPTDGELFWSGEHQMSPYPEGYHGALDRKLDAPNKATEAMTELCCERAALERFVGEVRDHARREHVNIVSAMVRLVEPDGETFLAWAQKPYACLTLHIHIEHTTGGVIRGADALRRLVDTALRNGGTYVPTYHRYALQRQVQVAFPQLPDFIRLKRKYDPGEVYQSEWYRHYKRMFFPESK
jgi:FAD/FMN-containing dehydrogenase